ncbi:phage tail protein [Novosphingobium mangrovi (ex Huang et al. 2023)]|uniref:Phage tail protein n=1 Tax=Novosphingobium mangrovi (ex Huang et al. 2023) TaxID=2976432 RepID=A0ABT2I311_9SPHN|nr:phage tail protein [Novosphingobium mangrovi (ex Huang et al. 2023)]MCT2399195.1 phage tail protein [Novosphingobium mangrovi (ex Huang et al. 2023)]
MATIVFNAVGTYLGGPIGGAIGSLFGRQFDTALFGTSSRRGPRLTELAVSTSSYGQLLPRHFGRMRVAGAIIWAADLVEHSETRGGGKGAPSMTAYSYTASFAVALASRPISGLGRIWADGKLLRGEAGDLKVGGTLRIHTGEGDQAADPLMLSAEGEASCPACRDLAYVVFEDLDLADYFNRIPALTFEVIADEGFGLEDVIGDLLEDVDAGVALQGIAGWTCDGPLFESLQALGQVVPLQADAGAETLVIARERLQGDTIALPEPAVATGDDAFGTVSGFTRHRAPPPERPPSTLRYYDTGRDYQPSLQHASGRSAPGGADTIELPAALDSATARALIEKTARRIDWARERMSWRSCELDPAVAPGTIVTLPAVAGHWRVLDWEWCESGVELSLERMLPTGADTTPDLAADPGRANPPADDPTGTSALVAFELPLDAAGTPADAPRPFAAVASTSAHWSGAALYADRGDGALLPLGPSGRTRSVIGTAASVLSPASPLLFDRSSQLLVSLVDPAMQLVPADTRQLAFGANLALVGEEILQFAQATSLGSGNWRLEGLLRGRGGTEPAIATHGTGEAFVLLDARPVALNPAILGREPARQVVAIGRGDSDPVAAPVLLDGVTLRPLAPVHPRCATLADGTWRLSWTRRARGGWQWQDGVDMPLVEQAETYLVTLGPIDAPVAMWSTAGPLLEIPAQVISDLSATAPGTALRVRQQGTHSLSAPLLLCTLP